MSLKDEEIKKEDSSQNKKSNVGLTPIKTKTDDTSIYSNDREYFISTVIIEMIKVKTIIVLYFILSILNLLCIYFFPRFARNVINIIVNIILILWIIALGLLYIKKNPNTDYVDAYSYKKAFYSIYITLGVGLLIIIDITYFIVNHIIKEYNEWWNYLSQGAGIKEIILLVSSFCIYYMLNLTMPFYLISKFCKIKNSIKSVGVIEGQPYSITYTVNNIPTLELATESNGEKNEKEEIEKIENEEIIQNGGIPEILRNKI